VAIYSTAMSEKIVKLSAKCSAINYRSFMDILNDDHVSVENKEISNAVNLVVNSYFVKPSILFYAFGYRAGVGDKELYKSAYEKLYPFVLQNYGLNLIVNKNKAMNLLSYLIINYHGRILKDIDKALLRTMMDRLSIVDHRKRSFKYLECICLLKKYSIIFMIYRNTRRVYNTYFACTYLRSV
jgi:hypothetical protein